MKVTLGQHSLAQPGGVNQDFHGAMLPTGHARAARGIALAVADGIASSRVSQIASSAAVRGFLEDYYATPDAWPVRRAAQQVLAATNAWLHAQNQRGPARFDKDSGYVCAFSALILHGRELHLLHVGDARICRVHPQALEPLTEDHRLHVGGGQSYLARALGLHAHVEIDTRCWPAEVGDLYLLATDGAHGHIAADDLDAAARALCELARAQGSEDDATVQLLRIDALPAATGLNTLLPRDGLRLPPPLAPRMAFEGYTIVRALHVGPRSHVHLATDDATGEPVALKTPAASAHEDAAFLDRFLLDEWVASRIDSPHVVRARAPQRPRGHLFAALEYVPGQTLAQWMVDHPRPALEEVRAIVEQVARGLQALHRREVLHQDLRPANVVIDAQGTARIIDLASAHVPGLHTASDGPPTTIEGTLQYTAPEYLTGQGGDARSDLFALAAIAYEMLTGQLPYGLQAARLRPGADARRLRYVPLTHHRPDLPDWLDAVLRKALHPQPARRQQAVAEFAHDLRAPGPDFHRRRAPPLAERDPVAFWQAVAALLALAVVALLGMLARMLL
jgi:serine/threonine protein phosphatase PrpC